MAERVERELRMGQEGRRRVEAIACNLMAPLYEEFAKQTAGRKMAEIGEPEWEQWRARIKAEWAKALFFASVCIE